MELAGVRYTLISILIGLHTPMYALNEALGFVWVHATTDVPRTISGSCGPR